MDVNGCHCRLPSNCHQNCILIGCTSMAFSDRLRDKFRPYKKQKEGDGTSSVKTQMSALEDGEDWSSSDEKYEVVDDGALPRRRKFSDSSHGSSDGKGSGGKRVSCVREEIHYLWRSNYMPIWLVGCLNSLLWLGAPRQVLVVTLQYYQQFSGFKS